MSIIDAFLVGVIGFGRNAVGIITRPYETYRRIIDRSSYTELIPLASLLSLYFTVASVVKAPLFRPYFLTKQFMVLASGVGLSFLLVVGALWVIGQKIGGKGTFRGILMGWAYTLIPTLLWFLATSLLSVFFPPPRTERVQGILFSVIYLLFSSVLFFWKLVLSYLTLRFGLRLDLKQILITSAITIPILGIYSFLMYKLGIFRIPFL